MFDVLEAVKYLIVAFSILGIFLHWRQARRLKGENYSWVKWGLGAILLFWAIYYTDSILNIHDGLHQTWVRTGIMVTIALIDALALISEKRKK